MGSCDLLGALRTFLTQEGVMRVRCNRDGTEFEAVPQPYPTSSRPSRMYDKDGDKRILCPTCGRAYFHYNEGQDLSDLGESGKTGWHSDRPLMTL